MSVLLTKGVGRMDTHHIWSVHHLVGVGFWAITNNAAVNIWIIYLFTTFREKGTEKERERNIS